VKIIELKECLARVHSKAKNELAKMVFMHLPLNLGDCHSFFESCMNSVDCNDKSKSRRHDIIGQYFSHSIIPRVGVRG
jgi:hypothetical protein